MSRKSLLTDPSNDAQLIQIVRTALGRKFHGASRLNVSSCGFVVTLHGVVESERERAEVEDIVRSIAGVEGVVNRLRCNEPPSSS